MAAASRVKSGNGDQGCLHPNACLFCSEIYLLFNSFLLAITKTLFFFLHFQKINFQSFARGREE